MDAIIWKDKIYTYQWLLDEIIYWIKEFNDKCLDQIIQEKKMIIGKSEVLDFFDNQETITQIGGLDQLKKWLKIRSRAFSKEFFSLNPLETC